MLPCCHVPAPAAPLAPRSQLWQLLVGQSALASGPASSLAEPVKVCLGKAGREELWRRRWVPGSAGAVVLAGSGVCCMLVHNMGACAALATMVSSLHWWLSAAG